MAKQQCLLGYKITLSQTSTIIDPLGTFDMAEHNPFMSQVRELLYFLSSSLLSVPQAPTCAFWHSGAEWLVPDV